MAHSDYFQRTRSSVVIATNYMYVLCVGTEGTPKRKVEVHSSCSVLTCMVVEEERVFWQGAQESMRKKVGENEGVVQHTRGNQSA